MSDGMIETLAPRADFPPTRLEAEGRKTETRAHVIAAAALGETAIAAHGDGCLRIFSGEGAPKTVIAHHGAILAMARESDRSVVTGGDDGRFRRAFADGSIEDIADFGAAWVDCVAAHEAAGLVACSVGRTVHIWRKGREEAETLDHPSTVGGLAFDPAGKRLAVAHYGGVTIWERGERRWKSSKLVWAGSHIGVTWSPNGKYVVSVMQENALHGWRLRDKADMRMSGYPAKPRAFDWVGDAPHLATGGADQAVCWPFDGKNGPMGRAPLCVAHGGKQIATMVRGLPGESVVIAGFQDGAVLMSELGKEEDVFVLRGSTGAEVTALAVTASLTHILIGDAEGGVLWAPLRQGKAHARTR